MNLENPSKDDLSNSMEETYRRVPLQQILMLYAINFTKKHFITVLFFLVGRLANFLRVGIKNNS